MLRARGQIDLGAVDADNFTRLDIHLGGVTACAFFVACAPLPQDDGTGHAELFTFEAVQALMQRGDRLFIDLVMRPLEFGLALCFWKSMTFGPITSQSLTLPPELENWSIVPSRVAIAGSSSPTSLRLCIA